MEKKNIKIYTDGACSGNPGPGGYAAIIMYNKAEKEIFGAKLNTTNNQMELMAAIKGLEALKEPCNVEVYSDSSYLVNAYNSNWIETWKKNNWKNSSKQLVKNKELWERLEKLADIHNIKYIKVKGHSNNEFNNRCDKLAVEAIKLLEKGKIKEEV